MLEDRSLDELGTGEEGEKEKEKEKGTLVEGGFVGSAGEPVKEDTICGLNIRSGILYLSPPTSTCWPSGSS